MRTYLLMVLPVALFLAGCSGAPTTGPRGSGTKPAPSATGEEAEIRDNLAKLSPEDRKLAEAQKFCVVQDKNRLGSMGKPIKVMVKDQPVFLCCEHCRKKALADPDKTLAKVKELKAKAGAAGSK